MEGPIEPVRRAPTHVGESHPPNERRKRREPERTTVDDRDDPSDDANPDDGEDDPKGVHIDIRA